MPALNYRTRDCAYPEGKCPWGASACAFRHATGQGGSAKAKDTAHIKSALNDGGNSSQVQPKAKPVAATPARGVSSSAPSGSTGDFEGDDASDTMSLDNFVPESKEVAPASNSSTKGKKHPYYRTLPCVLGSTDLECPRGASCTYIHVRQKELEGTNSGTKAKKRSVAGGNSKFAYSASLECKYSTTDAGCPFGKNCTFRHSSERRVKASVRPKEETLEEKARRLARQTELEEFLKTELPGTKPHHGNSTSTWATVAAHGKAKVNVQPPQKSDKGNPFKLLRHVNDPEDDEDSENEQRADSPPSLSNPAAGATASTASVSDLADEQDSVDKGVESVSSNLAEGTSEAACSVAAEVLSGSDLPPLVHTVSRPEDKALASGWEASPSDMQRGVDQLCSMIEQEAMLSDVVVIECLQTISVSKRAELLNLGHPVLYAIKAGRPKLASVLIHCGAATVSKRSRALDAAVFAICAEHVTSAHDMAIMLEALLAAGADISAIPARLYRHEPLNMAELDDLLLKDEDWDVALIIQFYTRATCAVRSLLAARAAVASDMIAANHFASIVNHRDAILGGDESRPLTAVFAGPADHGQVHCAKQMAQAAGMRFHIVKGEGGEGIDDATLTMLAKGKGAPVLLFLDRFDKYPEALKEAWVDVMRDGCLVAKTEKGSVTIDCQAFVIVASVSAGMKQIAAWWKETESQKLDDRVLSEATLSFAAGELRDTLEDSIGDFASEADFIVPVAPLATARAEEVAAYLLSAFRQQIDKDSIETLDMKEEMKVVRAAAGRYRYQTGFRGIRLALAGNVGVGNLPVS